MDGGAWWATVHGVGVSQTRLSVHAHVYYILGERYKVKDLIFVKKKTQKYFRKKKKESYSHVSGIQMVLVPQRLLGKRRD